VSGWPAAYRCADLTGLARGRYSLRPIAWADRVPIREWRNAQIDVLRQAAPLSIAGQDAYFANVVRPQFDEAEPAQVLVALLDDDRLIGYGGLVHISWPNRRAEVSFMTEGGRQDEATFRADLGAFLDLMVEMATERIRLHRLTTECYEFRTVFIEELERAGFEPEGRLREHIRVDDDYADSMLHGRLLTAG
jgi:RimJ/RimL family protein N-acetyltransferase